MMCFFNFRTSRLHLLSATVGLVCLSLIAQRSSLNHGGGPQSLPLARNQSKGNGLDDDRKFRFPSVDRRVQLYMSNWYLPPCDPTVDSIEYNASFNETFYLMTEAKVDVQEASLPRRNNIVAPKKVIVDKLFAMTQEELDSCIAKGNSWDMCSFCEDLKSTVYDAGLYSFDDHAVPPLLVQFGDHAKCRVRDATYRFAEHPAIPLLQKMRRSMSVQELERMISPTTEGQQCVTSRPTLQRASGRGHHELQPIVWLLTFGRHFGPIQTVPSADRPWTEKLNAAVFRGALTGRGNQNSFEKGKNDEEVCHALPRCRLVLQSANLTAIDAKLTSTKGIVPNVLNGVQLTGSKWTQSELLAYKGCIVLEGNDVASGLKWMLFSNSVVLMPPPKFTSWAMEELLEPWVHYIPLHPDLSDVEEKVQWMMDHDAKAQNIARRATLWIRDLLHHPDAASDNALVNQEIIRRYKAHFRSR